MERLEVVTHEKLGDIRYLVSEGKRWYVAMDISNLLGYSQNDTKVFKHVIKDDKMFIAPFRYQHLSKIKEDGGILMLPPVTRILLVNEEGLKKAITKSKQPNAIELAKMFGINVSTNLYTTMQQETSYAIMNAIPIDWQIEYWIEPYRIDLYSEKYKLAIECDEYEHTDYQLDQEQIRQFYIEEKLDCTFIRYNPNEDNFNLFEVLGKIFTYIHNFDNSKNN